MSPARSLPVVFLALAGCVTPRLADRLSAIDALEDRRSTGSGQLQAWTRAGAPLEVRQRALLALARLQDPETAPDLVVALADPQAPVREWGAFAAGQLGLAWVPLEEGVREALASAVLQAEGVEGEAAARDAELEALGRLRTPAALARLVARLEVGSPLVGRAAQALGVGVKNGGSSPPEALGRLLAVLASDPPEATRLAVAWSLLQLKDARAVSALVACTRDPTAQVRAVCAKGLAEHGGPLAVPALQRLLAEDEALVAAEAARTLARLATRCPGAACEALDALASLTRWAPRLGQQAGAAQPLLALAQAPLPPEAGPLLARLRLALGRLEQAPDAANLDCRLAAAQDRLRGALVEVRGCGGGLVEEARRLALGLRELAEAPASSPEARVALVLPYLTRPEPRVRLAAVEALAAAKAPTAVPPLVALLTSPDAVLAAAAAGALGGLGATSAVTPVLALARREAGTVEVIPTLAEALSALRAQEALPELRAWLGHPEETVRAAAAAALTSITGVAVPVPRVERPVSSPPPAPLPPGTSLVLELARGSIVIALATADAPRTAANLASLARRGFLDGLTFHRVVPDFVAQGGDPRGDGEGGPGYTLRCELNRRPYRRGAVGMALSGKDTGGSQFFLTLAPQPHLEGRYTILGEVSRGLEVADGLLEGEVIVRATVVEP